MNDQPHIDRELLIPILIGGVSVFGIIIVLLMGRLVNSAPEIPPTPSATPFRYIYLGTEPAITTPLPEDFGTELPLDVTPFEETLIIVPPQTQSGGSPNGGGVITAGPPGVAPTIVRTRTPSSVSTSVTTSPGVTAYTYDDTDSRLMYVGTWVSQANVNEAHQGTLHVSSNIGNLVTFTFTGPEVRLYYQAGPSLGSITITIDGLGGPPLSQAQSETQIKVWSSSSLTSAAHTIVVAHSDGGSVNIDSLVVTGTAP